MITDKEIIIIHKDGSRTVKRPRLEMDIPESEAIKYNNLFTK